MSQVAGFLAGLLEWFFLEYASGALLDWRASSRKDRAPRRPLPLVLRGPSGPTTTDTSVIGWHACRTGTAVLGLALTGLVARLNWASDWRERWAVFTLDFGDHHFKGHGHGLGRLGRLWRVGLRLPPDPGGAGMTRARPQPATEDQAGWMSSGQSTQASRHPATSFGNCSQAPEELPPCRNATCNPDWVTGRIIGKPLSLAWLQLFS